MPDRKMVKKFNGRVQLLQDGSDTIPKVYSIDGTPVEGYIEKSMYWQNGKKIENQTDVNEAQDYKRVIICFHYNGNNLLPLVSICGNRVERSGPLTTWFPSPTAMSIAGQYPGPDTICYERFYGERSPKDGIQAYEGIVDKDDIQPPASVSEALQNGWVQRKVTFTPEEIEFVETYNKNKFIKNDIPQQNAFSVENSVQIVKPEAKDKIKGEVKNKSKYDIKNRAKFFKVLANLMKKIKAETKNESKEEVKSEKKFEVKDGRIISLKKSVNKEGLAQTLKPRKLKDGEIFRLFKRGKELKTVYKPKLDQSGTTSFQCKEESNISCGIETHHKKK